MKCENCGAECGRDEVDVGVGIIYGPYGCGCGWSEDERYNILDGPKETKDGYTIDQYGGATPPAKNKGVDWNKVPEVVQEDELAIFKRDAFSS